jgi:hypothetical protein
MSPYPDCAILAAAFLLYRLNWRVSPTASYSSTGKYISLAHFYVPQLLCRPAVIEPGLNITPRSSKIPHYELLTAALKDLRVIAMMW